MHSRLLAATAAALLSVPGVAHAKGAMVPGPSAKASYSAKIVVNTVARAQPGSGKAVQTLKPHAPIYGGQHVLLVMGSARQNGKVWLKVQLSKRPNGATAWVPADQVLVRRNTYRVVVDISSRTVTAFKGARKAFSSKAVVGSSATPTPTGTFAVLESVPQPRGSKLGSTVIALTAHSNVHKTFDGGDGRVGIHGYERLGNRLGSAASNGCIRIPASTLKKLAQATPGTPVIVQQ